MYLCFFTAPFFSGQQIPFAEFVLLVTSSSITVRIPKSLFSDKNGVVTAYTLVVVQVGGKCGLQNLKRGNLGLLIKAGYTFGHSPQ